MEATNEEAMSNNLARDSRGLASLDRNLLCGWPGRRKGHQAVGAGRGGCICTAPPNRVAGHISGERVVVSLNDRRVLPPWTRLKA
jgi:hypothetical protein